MDGYLAGRLRSRWVAVHGDEVHFRDTAHGFLAWAVASLVTAALLTSAIGAIVGGGVRAGATLAGVAAAGASTGVLATARNATAGSAQADAIPVAYFVDTLFRKDGNAAGASTEQGTDSGASTTAEVGRIFATNLQNTGLPAEDVRYVGQLVAQRTGLSQADAEKRVNDTYARIQSSMQMAKTIATEAADKARKASAGASLWLFISLLVGAFIASLSATYGGRQRDL